MSFRTMLLIAACFCPLSAVGENDAVSENDPRALIREARAWAQEVGESLWPGFADAPFSVLLVTEREERLYCHPRSLPGFLDRGRDPVLECRVQARAAQLPPAMLASFPLSDGVPAIVIGTPGATGKTERGWQLTLLHEHFHQQQYSQPGYFEGVDGLGLSGGDETGAWMLNYPFPYDRAETAAALDDMAQRLLDALEAEPEGSAAAAARYRQARESARNTVSETDWAYLEFQVWQEGVALWTELSLAKRIPELAAEAERLERGIKDALRDLKAENRRRLALYPLGAGEAMLLEAAGTDWQHLYWSQPFALAGALERLSEGR